MKNITPNSFEVYNQLWLDKKIKKPIIIFIGGYCGTGKTTFAKLLKRHLVESLSIPTGVIRSMAQAFRKNNQLLKYHTYDLYRLANLPRQIYNLYKRQAGYLYLPLKYITDFAISEKQNYIIEGNHIFPELFKTFQENNYISLYFKCSDESQFLRNLCGPNHPRCLTKNQLNTAKILHSQTIQELTKKQQMVFEYNQTRKALAYVNNQLKIKIPSLT